MTRLADVPRTLSGTLTITLSDAFDAFNAGTWSRGSSANTVIVADGGNNVLRNAGVNNWGLSTL
ncbi:MAG TPA: hypothetical protein VFL17_11290 [Anaerolineae bacterium]|nr:hypothetical protein [Anaerolineae bacterium]